MIASLAQFPASLEPELAATKLRIAALRHEVERLRGMATVRVRRKIHPDWIDLANGAVPWPAAGRDVIDGAQSMNESR
ncbi:MAG: hypothetical protein ABI617_04295 [Sphingomicrobium sp.]